MENIFHKSRTHEEEILNDHDDMVEIARAGLIAVLVARDLSPENGCRKEKHWPGREEKYSKEVGLRARQSGLNGRNRSETFNAIIHSTWMLSKKI